MMIVEKVNNVAFKALFSGDVFREADGTYWMKIDSIDSWEGPDEAGIINAVCLNDGRYCFVEDDAKVEYVDCELRVQ